MPRRACFMIAILLLSISLFGCAREESVLQDGYYTAEEAEFDSDGWRKFLTIYVRDNKIVTAEYNAKNRSGFLKSWDMDYTRNMRTKAGTFPTEYTRLYAVALLNGQSPDAVDAVSGATHSHTTFTILAHTAISQSLKGDTQVAYVDLPDIAS